MKDTELLTIAKQLGYDDKAIHRDSLDDAKEFVSKIAKRCGGNAEHEIEYAMAVVINTMAMSVARRVKSEVDARE
ncbi:hypothetical protein GCM10023116_03860 [Kistimonas scapharcae]|uniref:Phage protein n=1 Tax=Kistimonas scapharcae TaxID=1036133 RepID=A0ABP8UZY6_9GAMM